MWNDLENKIVMVSEWDEEEVDKATKDGYENLPND